MACWLCGFETTEFATNAKAARCENGPCRICTKVSKVDEEINQAATSLRRLLAKRCDLRSEHNRAHGTLMHRLPVELKNHIFEHLLPSRNEWGEIPQSEKTMMPSFLASISVCKGWRDIALSNPSLWSTMHIALGTSNSSSRIHDWILRSGTLPLTLHIKIIEDHEQERPRRFLALVLDALSQCSNRLQSLSFDVPYHIGLQLNNFQYHRLTRLRIISSFRSYYQLQPLSLLNLTASPERIELRRIPLESLQISWYRLTSATVRSFDMEGVTQLFQYATQMVDCQILSLEHGPNVPVPPIIHHGLKSLSLRSATEGTALKFLDSLTLPCLQEIDTDETVLLTHLPALVHRSSCPLTRLTLFLDVEDEVSLSGDLQALPGVTDLDVETLDEDQAVVVKKLLLEGYFPGLRHLTLRLQAFLYLWDMGLIPLLLDWKRRRLDGPDEGRLDKFLVVNEDQAAQFDLLWNSDVGEQLMELDISLRDDGFEFL